MYQEKTNNISNISQFKVVRMTTIYNINLCLQIRKNTVIIKLKLLTYALLKQVSPKDNQNHT